MQLWARDEAAENQPAVYSLPSHRALNNPGAGDELEAPAKSFSVRYLEVSPLFMRREISAFLAARSQGQIVTMSLSLIALVGVSDFLTGYELSFSIFYLLPIALSSWYAGTRIRNLTCFLSAAAWFLADYVSGHPYRYFAMPLWNVSVRLGFFVIVANLLSHLRAAIDLQTSLAQRDSLTGVLNGRAFRERYESLAGLLGRNRRPIVLAYMDVDEFKGINDSLGHGVGDQVLRGVASTLTERLRKSDCVGRVGGDEFAILLPELDLGGARKLFAEIRENLIGLAHGHRWPIGYSIGVVVFYAPPPTADEAIGFADALMYKVKRGGKNDLMFEEVGDPHRDA